MSSYRVRKKLTAVDLVVVRRHRVSNVVSLSLWLRRRVCCASFLRNMADIRSNWGSPSSSSDSYMPCLKKFKGLSFRRLSLNLLRDGKGKTNLCCG